MMGTIEAFDSLTSLNLCPLYYHDVTLAAIWMDYYRGSMQFIKEIKNLQCDFKII